MAEREKESDLTLNATRSEEIERITRVVLAVLDAKGAQSKEQKSRPARFGDFLLTNWQLTALLLSAFVLIGASLMYGASPFHYFKQLAISDRELDTKEQQFSYQQTMAENHIALGIALLDQGRFKDAEAAFSEALGFDQYSIEAQRGIFKAAFFAPSSVQQFDPVVVEQRIATVFTDRKSGNIEDPHALAALGELMLETGRPDSAKSYYERAITLRPELTEAHAGIATIAFEANDFGTAAQAMQVAHDLAPSNPEYLINLASARLYSGEHDRAIAHYQEIFKIDPEKLSPYLECALAFRFKGDFVQSLSVIEYTLDFFDEALKLTKNSGSWFFVVNGDRHYMTRTEDKRDYAYYTARLSAYLAGDLEAAKRLDVDTGRLSLPPSQATREAILSEAIEIRRRHPGVSSTLDTYLLEAGIRAQP